MQQSVGARSPDRAAITLGGDGLFAVSSNALDSFAALERVPHMLRTIMNSSQPGSRPTTEADAVFAHALLQLGIEEETIIHQLTHDLTTSAAVESRLQEVRTLAAAAFIPLEEPPSPMVNVPSATPSGNTLRLMNRPALPSFKQLARLPPHSAQQQRQLNLTPNRGTPNRLPSLSLRGAPLRLALALNKTLSCSVSQPRLMPRDAR